MKIKEKKILVTGGDADRLIGLGLPGISRPDLVLSGLRDIHAGETPGGGGWRWCWCW